MKKLYIFSAFLDILEYLARCISNTVDIFTPRNKNHEDITAIEYLIDDPINTSENIIIYNKDRYSSGIENTWDKKIGLESNKFESIIYYLKKNNVLSYKKYYHALEFHSYNDLTNEVDDPDKEESVTITFKDGNKRRITSLFLKNRKS